MKESAGSHQGTSSRKRPAAIRKSGTAARSVAARRLLNDLVNIENKGHLSYFPKLKVASSILVARSRFIFRFQTEDSETLLEPCGSIAQNV
jgi:hypothetical protein